MSYSERVKDLFKRYGKIGVAVHLGVYGATFAGKSSSLFAACRLLSPELR